MAKLISAGLKSGIIALAVWPVLAGAQPAHAEVQSMAMGPQHFVLAPRGSTGAARPVISYCMEEELETPTAGDRLTNVAAGNAVACALDTKACVPLQTAIDAGDIAITGTDGFELWIENHSAVAISIELRGNTVVSDHRPRFSAPRRVLPTDRHDYEVQDGLWDDVAVERADTSCCASLLRRAPAWFERIESGDRSTAVFAIRRGDAAELAERVDAIATDFPSPRTIVLDGARLDPGRLGRLESDLAALFDELATVDRTAIVHSDDGRRLAVLYRVGGRPVAVVTRARDAAAALVDRLPGDVMLVQSGRSPALVLTAPRFTWRRSFSAVAPLAASAAHARSQRAVAPAMIVNGVPRTRRQIDAQRLPPSRLAAYQELATAVDEHAGRAGHAPVTTKAALVELLVHGDQDFAVIIAHSDGARLYIGDESISLSEIDSLPARRTPVPRTIILAACGAGKAATRLDELQGFAQRFVAKGFALSVVAPTETIKRPEVEKLFDALGTDLQTLMSKLQAIPGGWIRLGQLDALAPRNAEEA